MKYKDIRIVSFQDLRCHFKNRVRNQEYLKRRMS